MEKGVIITIVAIVAVLILGFALYLYSGNKPLENNNQIPVNSNTVSIMNFAFSPSTINVKVGDTIVWTNDDSVSHTVTSDTGNELNSKILSPSSSYSHTFTKAGTYNYHCEVHPKMKGKIIVS